MRQIPVHLSHAQFKTLTRGGSIRLKHEQMVNGGPHTLHLRSKVKARKLDKAIACNKGCAVRLDPDEFRAMVEGEGFKDFIRKAGKWFQGAAKTGWKAVKAVGRLAYKAADRGIDAAAQSAPIIAKEAAPVLAKAAVAYATGRGLNPADNVKDHIDEGLFGIHNRTPDHVLVNNNSNFIPASHPAANPTLLQQDPLARMALGPVVSGPNITKHVVPQALHPLYRQKENIRNTPAALVGGSFLASGY